MQQFNSRGILLIRNPYHALVSMWHFYNSGWHTTSAEFSEFQTDKFRKFVIRDIEFWLETIEDWVKMSDELHVVFYEELVDNTDKELRKVKIPSMMFKGHEGPILAATVIQKNWRTHKARVAYTYLKFLMSKATII